MNCKNQVHNLVPEIWSIYNFLQSDWPRTNWPIFQEPKFSETWDLRRNIVNKLSLQTKLRKNQ